MRQFAIYLNAKVCFCVWGCTNVCPVFGQCLGNGASINLKGTQNPIQRPGVVIFNPNKKAGVKTKLGPILVEWPLGFSSEALRQLV